MNAREVIAKALEQCNGKRMPEFEAANVYALLNKAGFTIMSKEDVEAVREALEPFANRAFQFDGADDDWFCNPSLQVKHFRTAEAAIRSLKSKEGKIDS